MNEEKWKRFMKNEMEKEMQEIDAILDGMNQDPKMRDLIAPEAIHENLFEQIHKGQEELDRLSEDEKELIRLGMVYKKTRKWAKVLVPLVAIVGAMVVSVTCMGGPTKVVEKVKGMLEGRERINTDGEDGDRVDEIEVSSEVAAYQKIEDTFDFRPVELVYFPDGIIFKEIIVVESAQSVYLNYAGENQETIVYSIYPNYRTGSVGRDVEDEVIDEYEKVVNDVTISVKKYKVEDNQANRYIAQFEYQNVYYVLRMNGVADTEVGKIIENLYFN